MGFGVGSRIKQGFDPFRHFSLKVDDCWIGNFEGVASETSNKYGHSARQFRIEPENLSQIKLLDLYGLANNHVMQHGDKAYQRTFDYLKSRGCMCFGSIEKKTQFFEHQGRSISITGFSQRIDAFSPEPCYWHNPEYRDIEQELSGIPQQTYKIVFIHWGNEFINRPSSPQKKFAHWLVDSGFDLVIGMHPHVLQGYEQYKGKFIFYSLGNFVFDMPWEPTKYGAIVNLDFSLLEPILTVDYVRINKDFTPILINTSEVPDSFRFDYLNRRLDIDDNTEAYFAEMDVCYRQYRRANHRDILCKFIKHPSIFSSTIKDFIKRRL